jgi:nucleoside-diphosphate-sugar epimerase
MRANRDGTARVLEALGPGVRRLVLVSSIAAAGPSAPGRPLDEDRVPQPITDYGRSKLAGELLVRQAAVPWTIVRPVVVYGEWDRELLRIFRAARRGLGAVFGDGAQQLSVIYAGDLADALIAAGTTEAAAGGTYFATHDEPTTSRELVRAVARATGARRDPRIVAIPPALGRGALWAIGSLAHLIGRSTVLSADKANEFLAPAWTCRAAALARDTGWRARTDLAAGLARTAAWYRERRWL